MALATRCPECGARFRVVADQLKLRGGLVRCGQCRAVFDAVGALSYLRDERREPTPLARPAGVATVPGSTVPSPPEVSADELNPPTLLLRDPTPARPDLTTDAAAATGAKDEAPGSALRDEGTFGESRHGAAGTSRDIPAAAAAQAAPVPARPETATAPSAAAASEDAEAQPAFLRDRRADRLGRWLWGTAAALLTAGLIGQAVLTWQAELLARWPALYPLADAACARVGCTPHWPQRPEQIAVVGSDLQAVPNTGLLELNAVLRNRATVPLDPPAIELTLTDAQNRVVLRRVFGRRDIDFGLPGGERAGSGLPPGEDTAVRIQFEARGISPVGFVLYPFYP